ncbi:hypothetical protein [Thalassolituus alkanivorans]|uniref:hypothetical protein n=1 Tax=Thalassolituus alkanivorans TaxID=2881055 RepID=UPI001E405E1B|nr:hypothetical protein [Thalassolituus alkanivorans]MCB2385646.1 hypothetical protein [Thalassolituus alkanivorans]MCB2422744.1 hypothetical protein [Thalassolituus alkanivorans]
MAGIAGTESCHSGYRTTALADKELITCLNIRQGKDWMPCALLAQPDHQSCAQPMRGLYLPFFLSVSGIFLPGKQAHCTAKSD